MCLDKGYDYDEVRDILHEPLSSVARSLGEKARELLGISPFRLRLDRFSGRRVIRIGFKHLSVCCRS